MKNQILAIMSAAKQLGVSAVACIVKGAVSGFLIALVLTLCCFCWGDSTMGLKYVLGFLFFVFSGVAISLYRIVKGEVNLLNNSVDSLVQTSVDKLGDKVSFLSGNLSPEQQFTQVKSFVSDKCPALAPLLAPVSFQQFQSLVSKSQKISALSSQINVQQNAVASLPDTLVSMVSPLKLVWQLPVSLFLRKVLYLVIAVVVVVIAVRALLVFVGI